jgi:hypothetical protein
VRAAGLPVERWLQTRSVSRVYSESCPTTWKMRKQRATIGLHQSQALVRVLAVRD